MSLVALLASLIYAEKCAPSVCHTDMASLNSCRQFGSDHVCNCDAPGWLPTDSFQSCGQVTPLASPTFMPAEYGLIQGVMLSYISNRGVLVATLAALISASAQVYILMAPGQEDEVNAFLINANADRTRISFIEGDTGQYDVSGDETGGNIWVRDYAPITVFQNGVMTLVQYVYDPIRPKSDRIPYLLAAAYDIPIMPLAIRHRGGNLAINRAQNEIIMSSLILEENPGLTEEQIITILRKALGVNLVTIYRRLPFAADGTGHIDMWLAFVNDTDVLVSQFPFGTTGYEETELGATDLKSRGYKVHRLPATLVGNVNNGGVHYTYTNVLIANNVVIIPAYFLPDDDVALAMWKSLLPTHTIQQLDARSLITNRGAIHCITAPIYGLLK